MVDIQAGGLTLTSERNPMGNRSAFNKAYRTYMRITAESIEPDSNLWAYAFEAAIYPALNALRTLKDQHLKNAIASFGFLLKTGTVMPVMSSNPLVDITRRSLHHPSVIGDYFTKVGFSPAQIALSVFGQQPDLPAEQQMILNRPFMFVGQQNLALAEPMIFPKHYFATITRSPILALGHLVFAASQARDYLAYMGGAEDPATIVRRAAAYESRFLYLASEAGHDFTLDVDAAHIVNLFPGDKIPEELIYTF